MKLMYTGIRAINCVDKDGQRPASDSSNPEINTF